MSNTEPSYSILYFFRRILKALPSRKRIQFWVLVVVMVIVALLEVVTLGAIAFYVTTISSPTVALNSNYVNFVRKMLDVNFLSTIHGLILSLSILVVCLVAGKNLLLSCLTYWSARYGAMVEAILGEKIFNGFLRLPYEWHLNKTSADLVLAVEWRRFLGRNFISLCLQILCDGLVIVFMLAALFVVQPMISLLVLVVIGSTAFGIIIKARRMLDSIGKRCRNYEQAINIQVTKAIHGIKDVIIAGKETAFLQDFKKKVYPLASSYGLQQVYVRIPPYTLETIGFLVLTGSICSMLFLMNSSIILVQGTLALLAVTAWRVFPALNRILAGWSGIRSYMPYIYSQIQYLDIIDKNTDIGRTELLQKEEPFQFQRDIRFENVSFSYMNSSSETLQNLNFCIQRGQTVGVIGVSGAGKSTFVDVLIGLLPVAKGHVLIDGTSLDANLCGAWVQSVGYVAQSPYILDGSLAENVAFGCTPAEIDRDRVLEVCIMASMQDFMNDLPQGIDTRIGERGVLLSGGQRQRVAIARALYHNPQVLIFDEATSSLDTKSEAEIQNTIYSLKGNNTLVIIAHRLSTVKECDLLIWLEKGRAKMVGEAKVVLGEYQKFLTGKKMGNNNDKEKV